MKAPSPKHRKTSWTPCQPGTIQRVACTNQQHGLDRRDFLQRLAGIGGAALIVGGGTYSFGWLGSPPSPTAGQIACVQVDQFLGDYIANRIEDKNLRQRISLHLRKCSSCQNSYRALSNAKGVCGRR